MIVVLASKYLQTGSGLTADGILRQHALNCELHSELRLLSHQGLVLNFLQTADPAGVMTIVLLGELLTGQNRLESNTFSRFRFYSLSYSRILTLHFIFYICDF